MFREKLNLKYKKVKEEYQGQTALQPLKEMLNTTRLATTRTLARGFHYCPVALARTKYNRGIKKEAPPPTVDTTQPTFPEPSPHLQITSPITPTAHNIVCPETHPLWQFFHDKQFIRPSSELDTSSRPWTVAELRRKSFQDLHSLWYHCLRERNRLVREIHLVRASLHTEVDSLVALDERVRTTMWRIRHVLSERDHAYRNAKLSPDFATQKDLLVKDFSKQFLEEKDEDKSWELLKRFQWSLFGINEVIESNVGHIDNTFVEGLKCVANLKLEKLSQQDEKIKDWCDKHKQLNESLLLTDVAQCFVIFACEYDVQSTLDACSVVEDLQKDPSTLIPPQRELDTVKSYVNQLLDK